MTTNHNAELLAMALKGYQSQLDTITTKMAELQVQLGGNRSTTITTSNGRRTLSPAARKSISAAQKKRWAAFHKAKETPKATAKREMSPEAKAKLVANLKKPRAAKKAKAKVVAIAS